MTEKWLEISLTATAAQADLLCGLLDSLGCAGVLVSERKLDTFVVPDPDAVEEGPLQLRAFFPQQPAEVLFERLAALLADYGALLPPLAALAPDARLIDGQDWAHGWKQHFTTLRIGRRLLVRPSWEAVTAGPEDALITLDPGMAFGTGSHETTFLCLEALADRFELQPVPRSLLDVGTGSGILAIAAAALGAERVLACDIDPQACATARDNAVINGVQDRVEVTAAPLEALPGGFDLVVANILAEENVRLAAELVNRLAPAGTLILSGILAEKQALVVAGFEPFFPEPPQIHQKNEWLCLIYARPG
ncbi:50S ribosomal protein L11 methyltransferase [Desulfuromonas thiophila]|uniref:50S ribosomal protein L11 methyltransferase n=1 Tax=Desulfuromonas thiophila TaxID=57664 RepID=UPI0029F494BC|nr:50S ribosomal protein L11 methyltransferase [Desulfuromonas thiophila]